MARKKLYGGYPLKEDMGKVKQIPNFSEKHVQGVFERCIRFRYRDHENFLIAYSRFKDGAECDGLVKGVNLDADELCLLLEYKKSKLSEEERLAQALLQVVFYLKRYEDLSDDLPNAILIGDSERAVVLPPHSLRKYLCLEDVDWSIAPSSAYKHYPDLVRRLMIDNDVYEHVHQFDFEHDTDEQIFECVESLASRSSCKHISDKCLSRAFDRFCREVVVDADSVDPNDLVALFVGVFVYSDDYKCPCGVASNGDEYGFEFPKVWDRDKKKWVEDKKIHKTKKNRLYPIKTPLDCDDSEHLKKFYCTHFTKFFSFLAEYKGDMEYSQEEKRKFTSIADRLIRDMERRRQGAFFTPDAFVHFAHKMITHHLGTHWCDDYVIWDCACGSKNLTRDLHCTPSLYCSTLLKCELEMGVRYNLNATSWVMDFLNDGDDVIPKSLIRAFEENKPIVFFINPPYGTAGNGIQKEHKAKTNNTKIREKMLKEKFGGSEDLQHQFMYRITKIVEKYNLTNAYFALFSNPTWLSGAKQGMFLKNFTSRWECKDAYLFQASHFPNVSGTWGISLTLWKSNKHVTPLTEYKLKLIDVLDDGSIDVIGSHSIYNSYFYNKASDWVKPTIDKETPMVEYPCFSSGFFKKNCVYMSYPHLLGSMLNDANNVQKNAQQVALFSSGSKSGHSSVVPIFTENFTRCTSLFTARKLIENTWINHKDEYLAPNENHPDYKRFEADSIVYSLFHNSSNQTSIHKVTWNEFFWMSRKQIKELANKHSDEVCDFIYEDESSSNERYVYRLLFEEHWYERLSPTAKAVLDKATDMVKKSMPYRAEYESTYKERHLRAWDAGWYQLKDVCKKYLPDKFKQFTQLFKQLGDELRPLVYSVGFLRQ